MTYGVGWEENQKLACAGFFRQSLLDRQEGQDVMKDKNMFFCPFSATVDDSHEAIVFRARPQIGGRLVSLIGVPITNIDKIQIYDLDERGDAIERTRREPTTRESRGDLVSFDESSKIRVGEVLQVSLSSLISVIDFVAIMRFDVALQGLDD